MTNVRRRPRRGAAGLARTKPPRSAALAPAPGSGFRGLDLGACNRSSHDGSPGAGSALQAGSTVRAVSTACSVG
eukprot:731458-Rhodomonas_salina.1